MSRYIEASKLGTLDTETRRSTTDEDFTGPYIEIMKIFNFLFLVTLVSAQESETRTLASKRVRKYYDFVNPFLDIFVTPKANGKLMKTKIAALDAKFKRYTNRFTKFYELCGTDGDGTRTRRDGMTTVVINKLKSF